MGAPTRKRGGGGGEETPKQKAALQCLRQGYPGEVPGLEATSPHEPEELHDRQGGMSC